MASRTAQLAQVGKRQIEISNLTKVLFPADHIFNTPIDGLPVHPDSALFMATITSRRLRPRGDHSADLAAAVLRHA